MFAQFSERMFQLTKNQEYHHRESTDPITDRHWAAQKVEMSTLINLHIVNPQRLTWGELSLYDAQERKTWEAMLDRVGHVSNIYILAGGECPDFEGVEEYLGQPVYSVFWHVNLTTGEVTVPKGQPQKIFDIRSLIHKACASNDIAQESPPKPKYKHPIVTYTLIIINAIILGLMYLDGYPGDFWTPMRFGAILPDLILREGEWWRLFTAMFVHFGFMHFFANAFGLLIFGSRVERYFGRVVFSVIYVVSGLLGSVFSLFLSQAYSAGASGAIYGLVGAIFAYTRITKRTIDSLNWYFMFIYIAMGFGMGLATTGIDNFGHLGGLVGGVVLGAGYALIGRAGVGGTHP